MALQSSGKITLIDIQGEFGGTAPHTLKEYYGEGGAPASGTISIKDFYGRAANTDIEDVASFTTVNGEDTLKQITVSTYISSGGQLTLPSNLWVWTDSTATPAITIDIPCIIVNNGKVIGMGGAGGDTTQDGQDGGPAIKINSGVSGVTIINNSGAYIAGGGGGGGPGSGSSAGSRRIGGGGGAGGGAGGQGSQSSHAAGAGGTINAVGVEGVYETGGSGRNAQGGGAGGGGGAYEWGLRIQGSGAGGGRILPGTGGSGGDGNASWNGVNTITYHGGQGGAAGNAGQNSQDGGAGGGGGGWGAAGGVGGNSGDVSSYSSSYAGGSGGAAISSPVSYTLTDNGTIYGST